MALEKVANLKLWIPNVANPILNTDIFREVGDSSELIELNYNPQNPTELWSASIKCVDPVSSKPRLIVWKEFAAMDLKHFVP